MDSTAARAPTEMELRVYNAIATETVAGTDACLRAARAAIRAMREPTIDMQLYGHFCLEEGGQEVSIWGVMIDEASPPEREVSK